MKVRAVQKDANANNDIVIFSGYESGKLYAHSALTGREMFSAQLPAGTSEESGGKRPIPMPITAIGVDAASRLGCVGCSEPKLFPFRIDAAWSSVSFDDVSHTLPQKGVNDICIRSDAKVFASAGWDGKLRYFALKKKPRPLAVAEFHEQSLNQVVFNSDSSLLACASSDCKISLWDIFSKKGDEKEQQE